jgi:transposase-like protein
MPPADAVPHLGRRLFEDVAVPWLRSASGRLRSAIGSGQAASGRLRDEAASKLLFLALRNAEKKWSVSPATWKSAINQFHIHFEGRLPV